MAPLRSQVLRKQGLHAHFVPDDQDQGGPGQGNARPGPQPWHEGVDLLELPGRAAGRLLAGVRDHHEVRAAHLDPGTLGGDGDPGQASGQARPRDAITRAVVRARWAWQLSFLEGPPV